MSATANLLAVKQDVDEKPTWLDQYASTGDYVPRVFFIKPDKQLDTRITSGNDQYPYFYNDPATLVAALNKAADA